jgi:plastocyanin
MKQLEAQPRIKLSLTAAVLVTALIGFSCGSGGGYGGGGNPMDGGGGGGGGTVKELNSGNIGTGNSFTHQFNTAGTFNYHCTHHPSMTGSVVVNDNATETTVNVSIVSNSQPFHAASVKPGGSVHWTNNTNMVHTVTSN